MKKRKYARASVILALIIQICFVWGLLGFLSMQREVEDSCHSCAHRSSGIICDGCGNAHDTDLADSGPGDLFQMAGGAQDSIDGLLVSREVNSSVAGGSFDPQGTAGAKGSWAMWSNPCKMLSALFRSDHEATLDRMAHSRRWFMGLALLQLAVLTVVLFIEEWQASKYADQAYHDRLTGLPNRQYLESHLQDVCERAEARGKIVSLAFLDLDGFKMANDRMGHRVGDLVLKRVANCLRGHCREGDLVARYGGDEFVVVFVNAAPEREKSLQRMRSLVTEAFTNIMRDPRCGHIGCSCGISVFPSPASNVEQLLQTADEAMYRAKKIPQRIAIESYRPQHRNKGGNKPGYGRSGRGFSGQAHA